MVALSSRAGALAQDLFEGETYSNLAGAPAVSYFAAGDVEKPLIVFIPGAHHTARLTYGGHEGSRPEEFLSHWLVSKGYNFLALSYPVETTSGMMTETMPAFSAQDWGNQIAEATTAAISEHGLSGDIYTAHWSMAGKVIQPAHAALAEAGHPVAAAFSFSATPGLPSPNIRELDRAHSGYADRVSSYQGWYEDIAANALGGDPIIPEDVYRDAYVGNIPISLEGFGEIYNPDGTITTDPFAQAITYGAFETGNYPWIVTFQPGQGDARHALNDNAYMTYYNSQTMSAELRRRDLSAGDLSDDQWAEFLSLTLDLSDLLTVDVGGNHFFFVGEAGASRTADAVDEAVAAVKALNLRLDDILLP